MNRYRNAPGVRGPTKATASTLCQKCLKRGHYSYECKITTQERPYLARPSRTQQLQNPKLRPQLTTDVPDATVPTKGTAGALLAQREEERGRKRDIDELDPSDGRAQSSKRTRSISSSSVSSVSTISTNRSRSKSPRRDRYDERRKGVRAKSQSSHHSWSRKRRHSDSSSGYSVSSHSSGERSRTRSPGRNIRRRRRESSPKERGRPRDISRDGGRRDRSRSHSIDKGRVTRGRWSITPDGTVPDRSYAARPSPRVQPSNSYNDRRQDERNRPLPPRRERSLSPFSKRLALTQAMNMGR
ncbi:zinc knuckle-domain-containing protein [Aspergillus cavernicola]|uniref:Zinc knuckle-domain-containing protein n=1 Tax=Aspergillus cavernicola TaxID=176166 RepID=A0ABR4IW59_9EURO